VCVGIPNVRVSRTLHTFSARKVLHISLRVCVASRTNSLFMLRMGGVVSLSVQLLSFYDTGAPPLVSSHFIERACFLFRPHLLHTTHAQDLSELFGNASKASMALMMKGGGGAHAGLQTRKR